MKKLIVGMSSLLFIIFTSFNISLANDKYISKNEIVKDVKQKQRITIKIKGSKNKNKLLNTVKRKTIRKISKISTRDLNSLSRVFYKIYFV